jgi:hypothetical protein
MKAILAVLVVSGALGLAACESDGYYGSSLYGSTAYGSTRYSDRYSDRYYSPQTVWHRGWYDNYYGPIYDGYWGPGDVFYYRVRPGDRFYRDDRRHFRRNEFRGGLAFRFEGRRG